MDSVSMNTTLDNFGFLKQLPLDTRHSLETIAARASFQPREYIFQANFSSEMIYVLVEGTVKLSRLSDQGQECIQWFCFPGEFFGFSEHTYKHDSGLYAQALQPSTLLIIDRQDFDQLALKTPSLALLVIEQLSRRVRTLGDMLLHITCGSAEDRLINLLQRLGDIYGQSENNRVDINIHLTHQEIADMIGVCRQTVSSLMAKMKKNGLISSDRSGIVIHDLSHLSASAR